MSDGNFGHWIIYRNESTKLALEYLWIDRIDIKFNLQGWEE